MIHKGKKNKSVYRKEEDEKYRISGFLGVFLFFAKYVPESFQVMKKEFMKIWHIPVLANKVDF